MRVVVLVPRRAGDARRDGVWGWCRANWRLHHPDWPIFEGHHNFGPFSVAAARNEAARRAGAWDVAVIADADVWVDPARVQAAVRRAAETGRVVWAFDRWCGLTLAGSTRLMATGEAREDDIAEVVPDSVAGVFAIPRAAWDRIGGYDERFRGWGFEDVAFAYAALLLVGGEHLEGPVWHLWHKRSRERDPHQPLYRANRKLGDRYRRAFVDRDPEAMDALLAEARELRAGVTVVVLSNGRAEYIQQAIPSFEANASGPIIRRRIFDDSGIPAFRAWLAQRFPEWPVIGYGPNVGYANAMAAVWRYIAARPGGFGFLLEEDFLFERPVDLAAMSAILEADPNLVQVSLLRQAWFEPERAAGGIVARWPEAFTPRRLNGYSWLEHRQFFTGNPSLFRRSLCEHPWPRVRRSERVYGEQLFTDPAMRAAILGAGEQWVTHIGEARTGRGY